MRGIGVLLLVVVACSSAGVDTGTVDLSAEIRSINNCELDAGLAAELIIVEREFAAMQNTIAEAGVESLNEQHRTMHDAMFEETIIRNGVFAPVIMGPLYEPGETTVADLRTRAGLRDVMRYSSTMARLWPDERSELDGRYNDELDLECQSRQPRAMRWMCDHGSPDTQLRACRGIEMYPNRDRAIIAEACEQVPYLLFCDPEDPPPWDPPEA